MAVAVAFFAVLVAISIPIFTSQLEKSREAVDAANIRAAYAEISADALTGDLPTTDMSKYDVKLKQTVTGWGSTFDFPSNLVGGTVEPASGATVSFTWDATTSQVKTTTKLTK